ncbi:MAG: hypothetical protein OQK82_09465 [Candidatus Pacearchaeota archaeon]|nr:hypothetical protein [Candidatus Pacearchaeota archaeon]
MNIYRYKEMEVKDNVIKLSKEEFRTRLMTADPFAGEAEIDDNKQKLLDNQYMLLAVALLSETFPQLKDNQAVRIFQYCEEQHIPLIDVINRKLPLVRVLQDAPLAG